MTEPITSPPAGFAPAGPAEAPPTEAAPAEPPAEAPPAEPDLFENEQIQQFDRSYVTKLREEAAARREEAKKYKAVFGDYPEEDQQVWFDLASTWKSDPAAAAEMMENIVKAVKAQGGTQAEAEAAAGAVVEGKPAGGAALTPEAVQKMIAAAQQDFQKEQDLQAKTSALIKQAEGLGYAQNTPQWRDLFSRAQHDHAGDMGAAHKAIEAEKQAIIDGFLKKKGATAGPAPVNQGAAPGTRTVPKTWAEAAAAFRAASGAVVGQ